MLVLCAGVLLPNNVLAQSRSAEQWVRQGAGYLRHGQNGEAVDAFRRAYEASSEPRALALMAVAEGALGHWVDAVTHLHEALTFEQDRYISRHRSELEGAFREMEHHVGRLMIRGGATGATVRVDQEVRGTLPLSQPITVLAGTVQYEMTAPGHLPLVGFVAVRPEVETTIEVTMSPEVPLAPPVPTRVAAAEGTPTARPLASPNPAPARSTEVARASTTTARRLAWVSLVGGVTFVIAGGAGLGFWQERVAYFNDLGGGQCGRIASDGAVFGGADCESAVRDGTIGFGMGVAGLALGGALALTSGILLRVSATRPPPVSVAFSGGRGAIGTSVVMRF